MYKSKKGVTLLEVIVYLSLLSIVVGLFPVAISYFKKQDNKVKIENQLTEINTFILEAKATCKNLNSIGEINYNELENYLKFNYEKNSVRLNLKDLRAKTRFTIYLNRNGYSNKKLEVQFIDSNLIKHTIRVN